MLLKDGTEKNGYRFTFEFADKEPVGKCPKCQGNIMNGKYGLYCENKCGYMIPNSLYGKKITVKQYKELLSGNKVLLKGIKSKRSGKEFDAFVSFTGVESFAYNKDGTDVTAYRSKTNIEFR